MPNFTRRTRLLFGGTDIIPPETFTLTPNSSLSLSASPIILVANPSPPPPNNQFCFMFWNVNGAVYSTAATSIASVGTGDFAGSAWYRNCNPGGSGGPASIQTAAFSVTQDLFLSETPIQSVTPAGAWAGGNNTGVNPAAGAVTITAKDEIGGEEFGGWLIFGAGAAGGGTNLNVPQNGSTLAIAHYTRPTRTQPTLEIEIFEFIERVRWRHEGDPSPLDLLRITERFTRRQQQQQPAPPQTPQADDLSDLAGRIGRMSADDLRMTIADLQARGGRVDAARKMAEATLKKLQGGK